MSVCSSLSIRMRMRMRVRLFAYSTRSTCEKVLVELGGRHREPFAPEKARCRQRRALRLTKGGAQQHAVAACRLCSPLESMTTRVPPARVAAAPRDTRPQHLERRAIDKHRCRQELAGALCPLLCCARIGSARSRWRGAVAAPNVAAVLADDIAHATVRGEIGGLRRLVHPNAHRARREQQLVVEATDARTSTLAGWAACW
mmetsp:Transcript_21249/g.45583  ORF Transcript_21249/g.45583 Transcript_21249/m.45583 type:complete len:201 (-) Transcript_21249:344-946(-)